MNNAVLRIVKAPQVWHCKCGTRIEASQQCAKLGSQILCLDCLRTGLPARPERKLTRAERLLQEAHYLALDEIADLTHLTEGDQLSLFQCLETDIAQVQNELGLRSMPYHGREHSLFTGINSHQLDAMLDVYNGFHQSIKVREQ